MAKKAQNTDNLLICLNIGIQMIKLSKPHMGTSRYEQEISCNNIHIECSYFSVFRNLLIINEQT